MHNRRTFFRKTVTTLGAVLVMAVPFPSWAKKYGLKMSQLPALKKVGGSVTVRLGKKEIILVRQSAKKIAALSAVCTHQKCLLQYDAKKGQLACGCHRSYFDMSGKVLGGPARSELEQFAASIQGDKLIVSVSNKE